MKTKKKAASQFPPRVRFNWGFHDATRDQFDGRPRARLMGGPQTRFAVSREHNADYFRGYSKGIEVARATGTRPESSDAAWLEMVMAGVYKA